MHSIFKGFASVIVSGLALFGAGQSASVVRTPVPTPVSTFELPATTTATTSEVEQLRQELEQEKTARLQLEAKIYSTQNKTKTSANAGLKNSVSNKTETPSTSQDPTAAVAQVNSVSTSSPSNSTITIAGATLTDNIISIHAPFPLDMQQTELVVLKNDKITTMYPIPPDTDGPVKNIKNDLMFSYGWSFKNALSSRFGFAVKGDVYVEIMLTPLVGGAPVVSQPFQLKDLPLDLLFH